jgi:hypothetical protein
VLAMTAITFFILVKGLKGQLLLCLQKETYEWIKGHPVNDYRLFNFVFWTLLCQVLMSFFKVNIFKFIIIVGTFALALAFAGNDLVNFIGVPIAAYQAYEIYLLRVKMWG